jgi:hypothetical protein
MRLTMFEIVAVERPVRRARSACVEAPTRTSASTTRC